MATENETEAGTRTNRFLNIAIWTAQIAIFLAFVLFGYMKLVTPINQLAAMWTWPGEVPAWFVRMMGLVDAAGGIGILIPAALRIRPRLTVYAAIGCVALQVCAIIFHGLREEYEALPLNFILLPICVFILWGRTKKAPIASR